MMWRTLRRILFIGPLILLFLGGSIFYAAQPSQVAQADDSTPPHRKAVLDVNYTLYSWWLVRYSNNSIVCAPKIEHAGLPTYNEIEGLCGKPLALDWLASKPCTLVEISSAECPGLYFVERGSEGKQRKVEVELPLPTVWIEVADCNPFPGSRKCSTLPALLLHGEEPLPNELILSIQGTLNGEPFSCQDSVCRLPMQPTGTEGVSMEFWADSSFGDSTEHYTAKIRLVPWGDFMSPDNKSTDQKAWYVDVLSSQWTGGDLASCSATWQVFPGLEGPPDWLSSPATVEGLSSDNGFYYLAGQLIQKGVVNADGCLDGGLQSANVASACGVEAARPALLEWQNKFDADILQTSQESGVPARLLKGVFARESQVWPGIFTTYKEAGLGQMTEKGADTVLLWNPDFFHQFCPLVLSKPYCDLGFGNLLAPEQNLLRGALVHQVNASCADCAAGIDLTKANYSVKVFAEGLLANCEQVGRILHNDTGQDAGQSSSYEDLWRFTLVNYNAGPGCLSNAINASIAVREVLDWEHVTAHLEPACQAAIGYVEDITAMLKVGPTPTPWLANAEPLATVQLPRVNTTPTPRPTGLVRTPTATPDLTETQAAPSPTPGQDGTNLPSPTPQATSYP